MSVLSQNSPAFDWYFILTSTPDGKCNREGINTGKDERKTKRVLAPRVAGDRYQMTGTGNRSCGQPCDRGQAQMGTGP